MGTLIYGPKISAEMDDLSLFHLDVILAELRGEPFRLHLTLGGRDDGNLVSLTVGAGNDLALVYLNGPELSIDEAVISTALSKIRKHGIVSLPFAFNGGDGEIGFS